MVLLDARHPRSQVQSRHLRLQWVNRSADDLMYWDYPKLFMPVMMLNGVGGINTVANNAVITIGASDGTNTVSCG